MGRSREKILHSGYLYLKITQDDRDSVVSVLNSVRFTKLILEKSLAFRQTPTDASKAIYHKPAFSKAQEYPNALIEYSI